MNISITTDDRTARTCEECAFQRASNIAQLGARTVLELCVGPSLRELERAYRQFNVEATGNDIDPRWQKYYPQGRWALGDALRLSYEGYDAIVFAPPLTRGCTGTREDSLRVDEVNPSYESFIERFTQLPVGVTGVCVLPGRSLATREDRTSTYGLMARTAKKGIVCNLMPLKAGRRQIVKYYDLVLRREG